MSKLTLSVDDEIISRAKQYAEEQGTSVSKLVESYLDVLSTPVRPADRSTPILQSLRGILHGGAKEDYQKHLEEKYR
jgi:Family of unknown function (DUF6364)